MFDAELARVPSKGSTWDYVRWRPYRDECTGSLQNSEVNRRRARIVLRWGTAREVLRVLPALLAFCGWGLLSGWGLLGGWRLLGGLGLLGEARGRLWAQAWSMASTAWSNHMLGYFGNLMGFSPLVSGL